MFKGYFTALITPFRNGAVDERAFQDFVDWQVREGIHGVVPCGTTGESPTLSHEEHRRVVELCIEAAAGRVPVIAGTGSNSTEEAISLTRHAERAGAEAALIVMPYYNKPTAEGQYRHFKEVAEAVDIPILIYNIPGRCVVDMSIETMARLALVRNIVGVKDATGDLTRPSRVRQRIGADFCQLSGEDGVALAFLAHGGHGCISVTANVAPRLCAEFYSAWEAGAAARALELHDRLMPLHETLFVETSPAPVKYAVSLLGHCGAELRLPLVEVAEASKHKVRAAMAAAGVLGEETARWQAAR